MRCAGVYSSAGVVWYGMVWNGIVQYVKVSLYLHF